ncbi:N-acetyltransferase, partial [Candidatus Bathyarchaeota archaeon]
IYELYGRPGWRRRGGAAKLMEAALERLRAGGSDVVTVWVAVDNEAAMRLYRKLGFRDLMLTLFKRLG